MNPDLKTFVATVIIRVVLPPLVVMAAVAFITMPYTLGHHPGEASVAVERTDYRHMT